MTRGSTAAFGLAVAAFGLRSGHALPERAVPPGPSAALIEECERHGTLGLLGEAVRAGALGLAPDARGALELRMRAQARHDLSVELALLRLGHELTAAGLEWRAVGSAALARTAYPRGSCARSTTHRYWSTGPMPRACGRSPQCRRWRRTSTPSGRCRTRAVTSSRLPTGSRWAATSWRRCPCPSASCCSAWTTTAPGRAEWPICVTSPRSWCASSPRWSTCCSSPAPGVASRSS